jgi:hypothetical protein
MTRETLKGSPVTTTNRPIEAVLPPALGGSLPVAAEGNLPVATPELNRGSMLISRITEGATSNNRSLDSATSVAGKKRKATKEGREVAVEEIMGKQPKL